MDDDGSEGVGVDAVAEGSLFLLVLPLGLPLFGLPAIMTRQR
jgi:hypothetical protein